MQTLWRFLSLLLFLSLVHLGPAACSSAQQEQGLQGEEQLQEDQEQEEQEEQQQQEQEEEEQQQQEEEQQQEQQQEQGDYNNAELNNEDLNGNEDQQVSDNEGFDNQLQNSDDELQQIMEQENESDQLNANQQDFEQNLQQTGEEFVDNNLDQEMQQDVEQQMDQEMQQVNDQMVDQVNDQMEQVVQNDQMQAEPMQEQMDQGGASMAAPAGKLPEMGTTMAYIVERGDTLGKIATKVYGSISKWREVMSLSNLADPNKIYPGDVVYYQLNEESYSFAERYENITRGSTTVQAGDTLAKISRRVYGTSSAWMNIWRQNDWINDPTKLIVGKTVYYVNAGEFVAETLKTAKKKVKQAFSYVKPAIKAVDNSLNITIEFVHSS